MIVLSQGRKSIGEGKRVKELLMSLKHLVSSANIRTLENWTEAEDHT